MSQLSSMMKLKLACRTIHKNQSSNQYYHVKGSQLIKNTYSCSFSTHTLPLSLSMLRLRTLSASSSTLMHLLPQSLGQRSFHSRVETGHHPANFMSLDRRLKPLPGHVWQTFFDPRINLEKSYSTPTSNDSNTPKPNSSNEEEKSVAVKSKKTLWVRVKEEVMHYYHGFKLFGLECKISSKLLFRMLKGHDLTRREQRQLRRTTSDIFRLVPFLIFIIVPFMELLLPVALKLFPNMLPSTFESKDQAEQKRQKLFKARLEVSNFLQETMAENARAGKSVNRDAALEFSELFRKVRNTGEPVSTKAILDLAKELKDDLTMDNLSRPQLVSLCRYLNIPAFGTDAMLGYQIRNRMRYLRADDRMINAEGVEELTDAELQQACQSRGIRTYQATREQMQNNLNQWLTLNLRHKVPATILIMSQAFALPESTEHFTPDAIQATLSSLPEELIKEAELTYSESVGHATNKQRLEVLEDMEEKIQEEKEQTEREEEARKKEEEEKQAEKKKLQSEANQSIPDSEVETPKDSKHSVEDQVKAESESSAKKN